MTRDRAIQAAALIILAALAFSVVADITSRFLAKDYNPIRETISMLAVGRSSWLIDLALRAFALACAVAAITMALIPQTGRLWLPGCLATGFLGLDVAWISFLNEYAGTENELANLHR